MSRIRYRWFVPALALLVLTIPGVAAARVHFSIGFGTVIGPCHPGYGWHTWPHSYWYDPWYDCWPVVVGPSVVVRERHVVVEAPRPPAPQPLANKPEPLSEQQQQRRSESLKKLRIGDVNNRVQAVQELAPFANGDKIREALQRALLADRDAQVRQAAAVLFGQLQDKKTLSTLRQAYREDSSREVQQAAYKAIVMIEGYQGL
jgi:hypothetical protein